jgi:DNA-binding MarR family transcriptional regulator
VKRDKVDTLVSQWREQRPDIASGVMAEVARIVLVARLIRARLEAKAAEHDLSIGDADVLFTLRRAGPPFRLSPSRLADSLLVTSGTMTSRLDKLERRGLVARVPNPKDRRGMDVELTPRAREMADDLVEEHVENEEQMLSGLSRTERKALDGAMRKLLAHLDRAPAEP